MNIDFKNENILQLIDNFVNNDEYNHETTKYLLLFINETSKEDFKGILSQLTHFKSESKLLGNISTKELIKLWKELIIDAINFLRINDARERSFMNGRQKSTVNDAADARKLNAYGVEELHSYFEEFTNFESVLYGSDEYYRDHVQHPLFVWLMGVHVLNECVESCTFRVANMAKTSIGESAKLDYYKSPDEAPEDENIIISSAEIGAMWTIIALTHDLGYPLQKVDQINFQLQKMLEKFGRVNFKPSEFSIGHQHSYLVKHLLTLISSSLERTDCDATRKFRTYIRSKYFTKFSKSWEMFEHGMISSLILLRSLTYFLETDSTIDGGKGLEFEDGRQFTIRAEMLHAIAAHTTPKVYHILGNNLAFILMLCDDLHEWERPTMSDIMSYKQSGANSVILEKLIIDESKGDIECKLNFPPSKLDIQHKNSMRVFKMWHERLRPAVDDKHRDMSFKWEIKYEDTDFPWIFKFNSSKPVFKEVEVTGPDLKDGKSKEKYDLYETKEAI